MTPVENTIPANQKLSVPCLGDSFYIVESDGDLYVQADSVGYGLFPEKTGYKFNSLFERLTIENRTGAPVSFRMNISLGGGYIDNR